MYGPSQFAINNEYASQGELSSCPLQEMKKTILFLKCQFGVNK